MAAKGITEKSAMKRMARHISDNYSLYIMLAPMVLFFIFFSYKPMIGLVIAFKKYSPFKGLWGSPWVGFRWFIEFFTGPYAWRIIRNTLTISLTNLLVGFPAPIILALLLNELRARRFKKLVQTVSYIPHFVSTVIVCSIISNFLSPTSGVVNAVIRMFGGETVYFMTQPQMFVPIYVGMEVWRGVGYGSIIYISALTSISEELYEAATVDGAGRWKQFVHVTLPGLLPTIMIMLLMRLGSILNVGYEAIILLYNPAIYETSDVISTFVYRTGIFEARYDYATAVGLFNSLIALVLVTTANALSNRYAEVGLW